METNNNAVNKAQAETNKRLLLWIAAVAVVILLGAVLFGIFNAGRTAGNSDVIQGSVKMTEIDLNSMLDGYIDEVLVRDGDKVKAGDVLIKMDADIVSAKVDQAKAGLAQAKATQAAAQAVLDKALNGARSEDVAKAKAQYDYAYSTYQRMQNLYTEGAVSQSDFENVKAQFLAAEATYNEAVTGARTEDIAAAQAQVAQAAGAVSQYEATVAETSSYLEHCEITAPADGTVTAVNVEPGELVSTGLALASMRSDADAWLEVNVPETMLGRLAEGMTVSYTMPAYGDRVFSGTIQNVSKNPDFATKKATNENGSFDVLSYCVKIQPNSADEQLYAGMTVIVDFATVTNAE